jgi:hypothetical protein
MTKSKLILVATLSLVLIPALKTLAQCQPGHYPNCDESVFKTDPALRTEQAIKDAVGIGATGATHEINRRLILRALNPSFSASQYVQIGESASQNIQNGGTSLSTAATSLVSKAMSSILGVAEEAGAISSSSSGSATTLTANIPQFFTDLGAPQGRCYVLSNSCSFGGALIRGASASVSLNTSKSTVPGQTNLSIATLQGITGVQNPVFSNFMFQENLHGRKKAGITQAEFQQTIGNIADNMSDNLLAADNEIQAQFIALPAYQTRLKSCILSLQQSDAIVDVRLKELLDACVNSFVDVAAAIPGINDKVTKFMQAETAYDVARDTALLHLFYRNTYSFEYDLTNNLNQPLQSTFKAIYGYSSKSGIFQTTANGSMTVYNSLEGSSLSRVRNAQGAIQLDYAPFTKPKLQAALSAGYYFQYMVANGLVNLPSTAFAPGTTIALPSNASVLLNTTGPIHIGQGKLTLSIKGTNIKIPLAVTGASRTDLIKANKVSGNFGISYDFSSLLSK